MTQTEIGQLIMVVDDKKNYKSTFREFDDSKKQIIMIHSSQPHNRCEVKKIEDKLNFMICSIEVSNFNQCYQVNIISNTYTTVSYKQGRDEQF